MIQFENSAAITRATIAKVNEILNYLFQLMRLPYELKINYEENGLSNIQVHGQHPKKTANQTPQQNQNQNQN